MGTTYHYWNGTAKWAKVHKPDPKYNKYSIDLFPDAKTLEEIHKSDIQTKERQNDEGVYYSLRRDHDKLIKDEVVTFGPPKVMIKTGEDSFEDFDGLIGNGSKVTVKVALYDTKVRGKGHRVEGVIVNDLVEYNPEGQGNSDYPF